MPDSPRRLPGRPNLRHLKLEAKRRLAAGEFTALHQAQLAIAREHGLPSWTALKELVLTGEGRHAFAQVMWVIARFRDAGSAGWAAPAEDELREHFDDGYLRRVPPQAMAGGLGRAAGRLGGELVIAGETPTRIRAQVADLRIEAAVEPSPPHRMTVLRVYPGGERVTDARVASPSSRTSGAVPPTAAEAAEASFAGLGLAGLVVAGEDWTLARGWADLSRNEPLRPGHLFPAYGVTKLITAAVVLRLVAAGRVGLDDPAGAYLRTVRPADASVTVRELLAHIGGVDDPEEMFADVVPDVRSLFGPVAACGGPRGVFGPGNGGYALLGQLIADVTASPYPEAARRLVLEPLGMDRSWFPGALPPDRAVAGHRLRDGVLEPDPVRLCVVPAAGGLWTTASDLVRFGARWRTLLPGDLAREALRPQDADARIGLGWLLAEGAAGHPGGGPGASVSLLIRPDGGPVTVALTNRLIPIERLNARVLSGLQRPR
ncbi:serine hydrolase domain-containing protein [Actinomadura sp. DC4]|uniref:serine hydrolase domain-containing protein n=1 Tax=Actinomadura sp. DC4 TaxID=3055069 RepID=UPI0025B1D8ED|nr:serine hydrolase domain-containing protein [Actinomadura sp. DC4]MDN3355809.1 serine hydrolase domain-containing protein [Actinomadura sp. DC4]